MKVLILSVLSILLLSACSTISPIQTQSIPVEREPLNLPMAQPLELSSPSWVIITPDNADEVFEYLKDQGYDPVIIGLTDSGYEKLSIDFAEIRQHINTQRKILLQYKQYYESDPSE